MVGWAPRNDAGKRMVGKRITAGSNLGRAHIRLPAIRMPKLFVPRPVVGWAGRNDLGKRMPLAVMSCPW